MRILLVEDDAMVGDSLCKALKIVNFTVDWTRDGGSAELALECGNYSLVLLDLGLPKKSGLAVLKLLRKRADSVPVLIITARDAVEDRILGLNSGADDYLVKPFDLDELVARMHALLRRNSGRADAAIVYGEITLDTIKHETWLKAVPLDLPAREFAILHALMENPGVVISRDQLEEKLYGWGDEIGSNTIAVYIHHLRQKFGADMIRNVRGVGYKMGKLR